MANDTLDEFLEKFYKLPLKFKLIIIDIVGIENRHECNQLLIAQLIDENDEIRIRSLKALSYLSTPLTQEELKRHLESESYEERLMALKICASVRKKEYIPLIIERMSDGIFVVRQQAGQAISRYPNGAELLKEISLQSHDQFARDMALEWLEKGS
nr:HEAT repeat domain-containing protein [Bacillus mesophilus]